MSQFTTAQDNQNHHRAAPTNNNNNHNDNLHQQQSPPIIQLENDHEDDDDEDVEFLEIVQKNVSSAVCLVKTGGKLDYHNDCLCVKCRIIKQFLVKLDCGETNDCDCVECRQNADRQNSVGDQQQEQQPQVPNEVTHSQAPLEPTNNEPQPEGFSPGNDVVDDDRYSKCSTPDYMPQIFSDDDEEEDDDDDDDEVQLPTPVNGQFQCPHCGKRFPTKPRARYLEHVIIHSGKKPFGCSRCWFKASRESNVSSHYRNLHSGRRLYRCSFCGFANSVFNDICAHIQNKHRTTLEHHGTENQSRTSWKSAIGKYVLKLFLAPKKK